jgi:signal transduction histidine kinase
VVEETSVKINLVSGDDRIRRLCQEVISDFIGGTCTLHIATEAWQECDADLFVWDTGRGVRSAFQPKAAEQWRHLFLVERAALGQFSGVEGYPEVNIVLKPVTKPTLAAFFLNACNRARQTAQTISDPRFNSLRADRDDILQCLMQANLKLQEYDHDRTNFLARGIHDFRAPLTAISGYCGLLLVGELGELSSRQREVVERMQRSGKKLSRMANEMFQLSIAPRAELSLDLGVTEIRDCIHQALNEILPTAEEKRISITVDLVASPRLLVADAAKLETVLVNLLENACKFTPRLGTIHVRGYGFFWERRRTPVAGPGSVIDRRYNDDWSPNCYRVDVSDSGPGIPEAHLAAVFEEYTSYAGGADRSGGGLGLAICRMIVNQHKGRIWAESTPEGTTFSFVVPVQKSDALGVEEQVGTRAVV